jgi:hypothetical protein
MAVASRMTFGTGVRYRPTSLSMSSPVSIPTQVERRHARFQKLREQADRSARHDDLEREVDVEVEEALVATEHAARERAVTRARDHAHRDIHRRHSRPVCSRMGGYAEQTRSSDAPSVTGMYSTLCEYLVAAP